MRTPVTGTNMTIFLLFFGIATLDAIRLHAWTQVALWIAVAAVFLLVDLGRARTRGDSA